MGEVGPLETRGSARSALRSGWSQGAVLIAAAGDAWALGGLGPACFMRQPQDSRLDLLVAARDVVGEQRISRVIIEDVNAPRARFEGVLLDKGRPDSFDSNGVGYPCVANVDGVTKLYFVGWRRLDGPIPFRNDIGAVCLDDSGLVCGRSSRALFESNPATSHGTGSCTVAPIGNRLHLLYTSFSSWRPLLDRWHHRYGIWQAPITDPQEAGQAVIPHSGSEYAVAHPTTIPCGDLTLCVFCARGVRYRLFAAISDDGGRWVRVPGHLEIPPGDADDEMQCYPRLAQVGDETWIAYSGNRYGRDALLLSRWQGPRLSSVVRGAWEELQGCTGAMPGVRADPSQTEAV